MKAKKKRNKSSVINMAKTKKERKELGYCGGYQHMAMTESKRVRSLLSIRPLTSPYSPPDHQIFVS